MAEKNSLWKNIRNKAAQNRRTGTTPKEPTEAMLEQERNIKSEEYAVGGFYPTQGPPKALFKGYAEGGYTNQDDPYLQYADGGPGCPVRPMDTLNPLPPQLIPTQDTPLILNTRMPGPAPERQMVMLHQRNNPSWGTKPQNDPNQNYIGGAGLEYNKGNGEGWKDVPQGQYIDNGNTYNSYVDYLKANPHLYNVQGGFAQGGYTNPYNQYQDDPYLNYASGGYTYAKGGWKKFGNTMADIGLGIGDVALGAIGSVTGIKSLQDTIGTDQYHNDDFDTGANFVGKLGGTALKYIPITAPFAAAAGVVGGVANAAIGIDRKNYDPSKHQNDLDKAGDIINFAGDVGTMFVDPTKAANAGAAAAKAGKTTAAAANTANTVGKVGQAASTTADVVDTAVKVGEVANTANQIGQAASTTADVVNTASNIGEVAAAAAPAAGALTTAATVAPATTTAANAISAAAKPVVDNASKLSSGLYSSKYYEAVEAANKISKYGNIAQTALSVGQPMMQQKQQQQQKQLAESTMGNEPMYPKPDANTEYAAITTPTFNTGVPQIGDNINTSNQFFSQGGNITNNSLNLRNTMRYKRFAQGGTLEQQGINFITKKAGLHHQNANGGVPIGPNALAEGGEAKLQMADGGQYIVSDQVDGANTQTINGQTMAERLKKKLKPFMMGGLASNPRDKEELRRPFDSVSAESIAQAKQESMQENEAVRMKTGGALQYAANGGKITPEIKKLVEAERKRLAQEEYTAAYGGKINPKNYPGLNYSKGGKVSNRNVQEFAKQILASKGGYVYNPMTQPMLAEGGPIYGDPASEYVYAKGGMYGNPYAEGGLDGVLPTQPITYRTDAGQPRQQMNWSGIEPGMPRPNNAKSIIVEPIEKEITPDFEGPRNTLDFTGNYTNVKTTPTDPTMLANQREAAAKLELSRIMGAKGNTTLGLTGNINYNNAAQPPIEEGSSTMLRRNPNITGNVGVTGSYNRGNTSVTGGLGYDPVTKTTTGNVGIKKSWARGGQIDYTNDMYSMYAGGGPMVGNAPQAFKGYAAQNRGGMLMTYADGGMMPQDQQMMQQQQQMPQQGGQDQMMQMVEQVMQALMQGAPPEQIMQQLVQSGVPPEQAQQIIQMAMQEAQGQQQQQQPMQGQEQMMPPQGMARGGRMYYAGGPEGGPGEPPKKRLYDIALEQQKYLLDNNAWQNDPEMVKPDGTFNLCLDCINVDWNNEDDIKDAHRLIEEGLSMGTHYSQDKFLEGLQKFNIPAPVFNRLNQPVSNTEMPQTMPQTHATGGVMYADGGLKGREKRRHEKMMRTSPAYRNYYNSVMGNKNIISDNALYSIPGIQDMTEQEIANYIKQETKVPTVDNPNNPATAITEAEARLHGWEPAVYNNATGWNTPAQPTQGPWQPGVSGTISTASIGNFYDQFTNDDIAYSNYRNGVLPQAGPLANNQLTADDKTALDFQEKNSELDRLSRNLIYNQNDKQSLYNAIPKEPEKLFERNTADVTPTVFPNKGLQYVADDAAKIVDPNNPNTPKGSEFSIGDAAMAAAQLAGPLHQLFQEKPEPFKYQKPQYKELSPEPSIIASNQGAREAQAMVDYNIKQNAPTSGSYLANIRASALQSAKQRGAAASAIRSDYDKINSAAYNRNQEVGADIDNTNIIDRQKDLANWKENQTNALYNAGANLAGMYRDKKMRDVYKNYVAPNIGSNNYEYTKDASGRWVLTPKNTTQSNFKVTKPGTTEQQNAQQVVQGTEPVASKSAYTSYVEPVVPPAKPYTGPMAAYLGKNNPNFNQQVINQVLNPEVGGDPVNRDVNYADVSDYMPLPDKTDTETIKSFHDWLDIYHPDDWTSSGKPLKKGKGYGNLGTQTKNAWQNYGKEFLGRVPNTYRANPNPAVIGYPDRDANNILDQLYSGI